jgi:GTP-binding protein EngB required for normal cell division
MNIVEQMSLWDIGTSYGYMPKKGIAGSWGRTIPSFLRNHQTCFQSGFTCLYSHQQWRNVPTSLTHKIVHLYSQYLGRSNWEFKIILEKKKEMKRKEKKRKEKKRKEKKRKSGDGGTLL